MRIMRNRRGYTMLEMILALVIGMVVVLALGRIFLTSQRSWEQGRDKVELQANTTEALEWMARAVRAAAFLEVVDQSHFRTYDAAGNQLHEYERVVVDGTGRLHEDGNNLVGRRCTLFQVVADAETTGVTVTLELEDRAGDRVNALTRATIRNRPLAF
jgi:type II secretory pathway pseudopilin PulG